MDGVGCKTPENANAEGVTGGDSGLAQRRGLMGWGVLTVCGLWQH